MKFPFASVRLQVYVWNVDKAMQKTWQKTWIVFSIFYKFIITLFEASVLGSAYT